MKGPRIGPDQPVKDVSVILCVRDMESAVAPLVRCAAELPVHVRQPADSFEGIALEIVALDERSGDNTLSVLSVLHSQIENLRTLQDVEVGTAVRRGSRAARGEVWLLLDHAIDPALGGWAISQILSGQRAAVVPGELLAVERNVGSTVLRDVSGGLVSAQNAVVRYLRARGEPPAFSPSPRRGPVQRARLILRGSLGRLGLTRFDRPRLK
jgi:hypothetical protein